VKYLNPYKGKSSNIDLSLTSNEVESLKKSLILTFSAKGKSKEHIKVMRKLGDTEVAGDMTVILTSQK
jgi:fructoselysine-6-P-deglycase FrlB-like protein